VSSWLEGQDYVAGFSEISQTIALTLSTAQPGKQNSFQAVTTPKKVKFGLAEPS
jgi:hypothetical protein